MNFQDHWTLQAVCFDISFMCFGYLDAPAQSIYPPATVGGWQKRSGAPDRSCATQTGLNIVAEKVGGFQGFFDDKSAGGKELISVLAKP